MISLNGRRRQRQPLAARRFKTWPRNVVLKQAVALIRSLQLDDQVTAKHQPIHSGFATSQSPFISSPPKTYLLSTTHTLTRASQALALLALPRHPAAVASTPAAPPPLPRPTAAWIPSGNCGAEAAVFLSSWVARVSPEPAARPAAAGRVKVEAVVDDDGFEWAAAAPPSAGDDVLGLLALLRRAEAGRQPRACEAGFRFFCPELELRA